MNFEQTTLVLVIILMASKWMAFFFKNLKMPELVGEIMAGVILGNLPLLGVDFDLADQMSKSGFLQYAAEFGVVILLFQVGLESSMKELARVGLSSFNVAALGVLIPVLAGVAMANATGFSTGIASWFVGATLAATSVGITAKILGDAGLIKTPSAQVILGAAVIDDVMGILILTVLAGIAATGAVSISELGLIIAKASFFFAGCFFIGRWVLPRFLIFSDLNTSTGFWTAFALWLALAFAQVSALSGLAPIIGSFMAGLVLEEVHFSQTKQIKMKGLQELLRPITDFMLPIFFVGVGAHVKLSVLGDVHTVFIIVLMLVVAMAGKLAAGAGVVGKGFDRIGIGIGMIPRGEVGLVFASFALKNRIMSDGVYSVMVFVVLLTTVLGPICLRPRLKKFVSETSG